MKKAMLVVGHGSRSDEAGKVFDEIIRLVKEKSGYDLVAGAHMELSEPTIERAVEILATENPSVIIIAPYFLYEGMHIKKDIPDIISALSKKYEKITFRIAKPIGFEPVLADIMIRRADSAFREMTNE